MKHDVLQWEPVFLGGVERIGSTENTVMTYHRLEQAIIMAIHPINHEPSVRATEGCGTFWINLSSAHSSV